MSSEPVASETSLKRRLLSLDRSTPDIRSGLSGCSARLWYYINQFSQGNDQFRTGPAWKYGGPNGTDALHEFLRVTLEGLPKHLILQYLAYRYMLLHPEDTVENQTMTNKQCLEEHVKGEHSEVLKMFKRNQGWGWNPDPDTLPEERDRKKEEKMAKFMRDNQKRFEAPTGSERAQDVFTTTAEAAKEDGEIVARDASPSKNTAGDQADTDLFSAQTKSRQKAKKKLLPIFDPPFNFRECAKQMVLLEEHLTNPQKRCFDCIRKHFLTIEGLAEEADTLCCEKWKQYRGKGGELAEKVRGLAMQFVQNKCPQEVSQGLRAIRKPLVKEFFTAVKENYY
jgi:hypothetical protein